MIGRWPKDLQDCGGWFKNINRNQCGLRGLCDRHYDHSNDCDTNVSQGMVMDCGGDSFTHRVVALFVDVNALLSLELANPKLENIEQWDPEFAVPQGPLHMRVHNNALYWTDTRNKVPLRAQEFQIGFRMPIEAMSLPVYMQLSC